MMLDKTTNISIEDGEAIRTRQEQLMTRLSELEESMRRNTELTEENSRLTIKALEAAVAAQEAAKPIAVKAGESYQMTLEIRDYMRAGKAGFSVLKYLGYLATAVAAIAAAWHEIFGGK